MRMTKVKTGKIKHSGILKTIVGLLGIGKNDYADVTPFHDDAFFRDCLKLPGVASEETLRQRIDELTQAQEIPEVIKFSNVEMLKKVSCFGTEKTAYGETGEPLYCTEFASWNILMDILPQELDNNTWQIQLLFDY